MKKKDPLPRTIRQAAGFETEPAGPAGRGRPQDDEREHMGYMANVERAFLPQAVALSILNRYAEGRADLAEINIREFVFKERRDDARRLAAELAPVLLEYPELYGKDDEKHPNLLADAAEMDEERRAGFLKATAEVREGLTELELMLNPQKVAAYAYRQVAGVEDKVPGDDSLAEKQRYSKVDVVKRAALETREIWDKIEADKYERLGKPKKR
jgi:hypothetical protein